MARPTIVEVRHLTCWLLIADIEDSTQLLRELSPEDATRIIGRWLSACAKIIDQEQGDLDKFLGDGFLAYWLAGNSAAASVVAALAALKTLQEAADLPFRIVLHYAQVSSAAPIGGQSLTGKEVNFVFRLEKLAGRLRQRRMLSEPAHAAINPLLPSTFNGRYALQGFVGEFPVYCF
jgi:adenylate cyclase